MEAVTTLSLLCTVMQVLSYGGGLISLSRRELRGTSTNATLDDGKIYFFETLMSTLEEKIAVFSANDSSPGDGNGAELDSPRRRASERIRSLASDLLRDSRALDLLLRRIVLTVELTGVARVAAIARFRVFHQSHIMALQRRISAARAILSEGFLTELCTSDEAAGVLSHEHLVETGCYLDRFVRRWAEGHRDISTLILGPMTPIDEGISVEPQSQRMSASSSMANFTK